MNIKKEALYQATDSAISGLKSLSGFPGWAITDLKKLDAKKQYNYNDLKIAIGNVDKYFLDDISDDQWQAT